MWSVWEGGGSELYKTIWLRSLKERDSSEDVNVDGRIIVK
jgi:hypothetical protein